MGLGKLECALFSLWIDTSKQRAFFSQLNFGAMKSNEFKIHLIRYKERVNNAFHFADYCSYSIIKELYAKYKANPRKLKGYMTNLAMDTPSPLAANAHRPEKEAAVQNYVSQFNRTNLVN